jgi:hypothetical protein
VLKVVAVTGDGACAIHGGEDVLLALPVEIRGLTGAPVSTGGGAHADYFLLPSRLVSDPF